MTIVRTRGNTAKVGISAEDQHLEDVIAGTNVSIDKSDPLNPVISSSSGGGTWGSITGTLSAQTDLQSALDAKADDLTNGNGTTANGSALDLGGVQSGNIDIDPAVAGTYEYRIGYNRQLSRIVGYTDFEVDFRSDNSGYTQGSSLLLQNSNSQIRAYGSGYDRKISFSNSGVILNLGSDATGDTYHRNSSGYLTRRGVITATSTATLTVNSDTTYQSCLTAQAEALTIANPTGTPFNGQDLLIRILDNGTARALTWNAIFRVIGVTLPTTTVINKTMYIACIYNLTDTKWDVIGVREQV